MTKRSTCSNCLRPTSMCYCSEIKNISIEKSVLIARHSSERKQAFNTAHMASLTIDQCTYIDSDKDSFKETITNFIDDDTILLFKTQESIPLTCETEFRKLLVVDGTWSKAKKLLYENKEIRDLPTYHLVDTPDSIFKGVRKSCGEDHLSTIEAIYEALKISERNNPSLSKMLDPLIRMIELQNQL